MPSLLDLIVLVVVLVSAFLAMIRGFVREVLTLASWGAAAAAAYLLYKLPLPLVKSFLNSTTAASVVSAGAIFLVALIVVGFLSMKIADFVVDSRVGAVDRGLGFLYGAGRGLLLMVVAQAFFLWLAQTTPAWMANAKSKPMLEGLGNQLIAALPQDLESSLKRYLGNHAGDTGQAADESPPDAAPGAATPEANAGSAAPGASGGPGPNAAARQQLDQLIQNGGN
jgi:membrane protein required for colicin V production